MPKPAGKKKLSKAAFVRSLPSTTPAKEVVAKAKAQGMVLSDAYVYNVRATSKTRKAGGRGGRRGPAPATLGSSGTRNAEDLLRAVASELGLARAISVLQAEHSRVRKLLGS